MNEEEIAKIKGMELYKRSSLKQHNPVSPIKLKDKTVKKRRSVNWDKSWELDSLKANNFKEMKITFDQGGKTDDRRKFSDYNFVRIGKSEDKFAEARKLSIKNEYTIAKEMMQKEDIDDVEKEGEIIENTMKNKVIGLGKDNENDSCSSHSDGDGEKEK